MPPFILHVEDDLMLRSLVSLTFQNLGFRGKTIFATTIAQGERQLDKAAQEGRRFDLIISDMHLPDGKGLDLVRFVRASPMWRTTPTLILSGDANPQLVGRAYALGANAYIDKAPPGRSVCDVVSTLYRHWLTDVVPAIGLAERSQAAISRAMKIRLRFAELYLRIAKQFDNEPDETAFWLSRALGESNLTNLLAFVQNQLEDHAIEDPLIEDIAKMHDRTEAGLGDLEYVLATQTLPRDEIYLRVGNLLGMTDLDTGARALAFLMPIVPVALEAFRDFMAAAMLEVTSWIERRTSSPDVKECAVHLRALAAQLAKIESVPASRSAT